MRGSLGARTFPLVAGAIVVILAVSSVTTSVLVPPPPASNGGPCGGAYPPTSWRQVTSPPIPVLVLNPGASGEICVTYTNDEGNQLSNETIYTGVWTPTSQPAAVGLTEVSPHMISVIPNPAAISFDQGARNQSVQVLFKVSVASDSTGGVYGLFLYQFCTLFPFAVGAQPLEANDFSSWYPHTGSCPAQIMGSEVTGVSGFQLIYVRG